MNTLILTGVTAAVLAAATAAPATAQTTKPLSQVVEWNKTLLVIIRTPGAQPATIHPTRSFAIMHAAIYDAVNAIDGTHKPYLVRLSASHFASQEAAAAAAAHEALAKLPARRIGLQLWRRRCLQPPVPRHRLWLLRAGRLESEAQPHSKSGIAHGD